MPPLSGVEARVVPASAWGGVPYHYFIDPAGVIHEGRPIAFAGDTNTDCDPTGHALVVVLGNFEDEVPTAGPLRALLLAPSPTSPRTPPPCSAA